MMRLQIIRKAARLVLAAVVVWGFLLPATAGGGSAKPAGRSRDQHQPRKTETVLLTGSRIPQKANRLGRIPTTHFPVVIIGRQEIDRTGQATIPGVLMRQPAFR